jgi:DNA polymerase-3 subunit epsilon
LSVEKDPNQKEDNMSQQLEWFLSAARRRDFLVLDTETTGLSDGEVCQIAVIDASGNTLLDTLVKPTRPIPSDASRIHGITDEMVKDAPDWLNVSLQLDKLLKNRRVMVYNKAYDYRILLNCDDLCGRGLNGQWKRHSMWDCVMLAYAEFYGDWNDYRKSYRWQKLADAATQQKVTVENVHSALGDCLMTLGVINAMIGK